MTGNTNQNIYLKIYSNEVNSASEKATCISILTVEHIQNLESGSETQQQEN